MADRINDDDLELLGELGIEAEPASAQRIIAGYEEIVRFVEQNGRLPQHGEKQDIFERLYAVRLDRMRESQECRKVLRDLDVRKLLGTEAAPDIAQLKDEPSDAEFSRTLSVKVSVKAAESYRK